MDLDHLADGQTWAGVEVCSRERAPEESRCSLSTEPKGLIEFFFILKKTEEKTIFIVSKINKKI